MDSTYHCIYDDAQIWKMSPLLANFWLTKSDEKFKDMAPKIFFRYGDDICMSIHKEDIASTLHLINNWHPNLKFIHEVEDSLGRKNFLDMAIINRNGLLESCWYIKSMNNGVTLNYHARAPVRYITRITHRYNTRNWWFVAL